MVKNGFLDPLDTQEFQVCESSLKGKMTKYDFPSKG